MLSVRKSVFLEFLGSILAVVKEAPVDLTPNSLVVHGMNLERTVGVRSKLPKDICINFTVEEEEEIALDVGNIYSTLNSLWWLSLIHI